MTFDGNRVWLAFSKAAFEKAITNSGTAEALVAQLEAAVTRSLHELVKTGLAEIVESLNAEGHRLAINFERPGEVSYRDVGGIEPGVDTWLRLSADLVVSAGYPDTRDPDPLQ